MGAILEVWSVDRKNVKREETNEKRGRKLREINSQYVFLILKKKKSTHEET